MKRSLNLALLPFALVVACLLLLSEVGQARSMAAARSSAVASPVTTCDPHWSLSSFPGPSVGWFSIDGMDAVSPSNIWVVGASVGGGGPDPAPVLHWDGSAWTRMAIPGFDGVYTLLTGVAAYSSSDVWVGGYTLAAIDRMLLAHWDGAAWAVQTNLPNSGMGQLLGMARVGPNNIWTVGLYYDQATGRTHVLTMHWNGSQWLQVPAPYPVLAKGSAPLVDGDSLLRGVSGTARAPDEAWAVGQYSSGAGDIPLIEHWDGAQWSIVPGPNLGTSSYLKSVISFSGTDAWAAGFTNNQGTYLPLAIRWDGSAWSNSDIPQVPLMTYYNPPPLGFSASGPGDLWFVSTSAGPPYKPVILHRTSNGWESVPTSLLPMDLGAPLNVLALSPQDVWLPGVLPESGPNQMIVFHYASTCNGVKPNK